jgi:hypothetical protein
MVAKKKAVKKSTAKKTPVKKDPPAPVVVAPVTDSTGVVTMKAVDDPGTLSEGKPMKLKPTLDKETGVITMVPVED